MIYTSEDGTKYVQNMKSLIRKEISDECEEAIEDELIRLEKGNDSAGQILYNILGIIRGEK